jgi:hypothetical protein
MAEKLITAKDLMSGVKGISEHEMFGRFEQFLKRVEADDYCIVPTISAFADYIEKPRADVHEWFRGHPTASRQMRDMCADTIASGAMLKKYVSNVTNFALKNWCGWEEAPQKKGKTSKEVADEKKAAEKLDAYYAAERRKFKVV